MARLLGEWLAGPGSHTSLGVRGGPYSKAQGLRLEEKKFLQRKLGLLSERENILQQPKNHKHATATCSNILKTVHRPNKTGLLAEGACQPPVPILSLFVS